MTHQTTFEQAAAHHRAGRLDDAEALYRRILSTEAGHADALHMLGVLTGQRGRLANAADLIRRAIGLRPDSYDFTSNLGVLLTQMGRLEEAATSYARAVALAPSLGQAHHNYATALQALTRHDEAIAEFHRAIELSPDHVEAYGGLGWSFLAQGRKQDAAAAYRRCVLLRPASAEAANNLGNILRDLGQVDEAVRLLRRAIALRPVFPEAHNNLGHALVALGELEQATDAYRAAVTQTPGFTRAWYHLGTTLFAQRRFDESIDALRQAVIQLPEHPEAQHALANALREAGKPAEAVEAYRRSIALRSDFAESYNNLGNLLQELGRVEEAVEAYRHALRARPDIPEAQFNLGNALHSLGRFEEAITAYRQALTLRPNYAEALNNLGNSLRERGLYAAAASAYQQALAIRPDYADAQSNLGMSLQQQGELEQAADAFARALELNPNSPEAHINLGNLLKDTGRLDDALDCYRKAHAVKPDSQASGNLLYAMHFHPGFGPREIYEEHARWNEQFVRPLTVWRRPHTNDRTPGRRLRIGYVSPDFREHPIGRFMLPLLMHHDRERFEICCYSDVRGDSPLTQILRRHVDLWRDTTGISDARFADLVRKDRIDVLVDLTMHMEGSRMLAFARKSAPVQVTYLAYCGTTGSEAIDYRLTDPYLDPPAAGLEQELAWDGRFYSEKSVRLRSYWCYLPPDDAPPVAPTPALSAGHVTFGCLNNFSKVSAPAMDAWCALMNRVAGSRMILHTQKGRHRERILAQFAGRGISGDRIELVSHLAMGDYLALHSRIDVALDPFPYPGGTTTLDAIWMGVPVVTLAGQTAVSRGGASVLSNLQHPELIAGDAAQYVRIAADLVADLPKLQALRAGLRERMNASPLMDAPAFARDIESAYRRMWEAWCASDAAQNLASSPRSPTAEELHASGIVLERQGRLNDAASAYRSAVALRPQWPEAHFHLANALYGGGNLEDAVAMYRQAIEMRPDYAEPFNNMGIALRALGKPEEAIEAFRRAVEIKPEYVDAHASLGMALRESGDLDGSEAACRRALAIQPNSTVALINLGNMLMTAGQIDDAIDCYRRAETTDPASIASHNLLFALNFSPSYTPAQIAAEHARWEASTVLPRIRPRTQHPNGREPDRRLKIGYVSSDFRDHVIGRFMLPLLANHDRRDFEVFSYSGALRPDHFTQKLRSCSDAWRETARLSHANIAQAITADQIDILVDLAMHDGTGLMVFAHKPAPVQVTYLAYAGTTGLHAVDYRLTDAYLDPPSANRGRPTGAEATPFVEKPIRLRTYWCYQPHENAPSVAPLPSKSQASGGSIAFGCFNNFTKINIAVLELWRQVIQAVPNSRLLLHAQEGAHRQRTRDFFAAAGVASNRIEFVGSVPHETYLRQYNQIDIALDPFPFGGATTTCDALYMGVPVITLPGQTPVSRAGLSILSTIGLPELVAQTGDQYVKLAGSLAHNPARLANLRAGLRNRMLASPLMAAAEFAQDIESCYRAIWRRWCRP